MHRGDANTATANRVYSRLAKSARDPLVQSTQRPTEADANMNLVSAIESPINVTWA